MSADHEFVGTHFYCMECGKGLAEHPPAQAPAPPTDPARKPADEDEAAIALARKIEQEQNAAAIEAVQFAHRMKRPKPGLVDKSGVITALLPYTRELIAYRDAESTARAQGRQAGAEAMREVALKAACRFCAEYGTVVDIRGHRHIHCRPNGDWYECFGARIRSATIPEPRS